jgi:WD40 repeat protein
MTMQPEMMLDEFRSERLLLESREKTSRLRALALSAIGLAATFCAIAAYTFYALEQRNRALSAARAALRDREQLERSTPVLAMSSDRRRAVSSAGWLLNEKGAPLAQLAEKAVAASFNPSGSLVFVVPLEGDPILANAQRGEIVQHFLDLRDVSFAAFSPDGRLLVICTMWGGADLWRVESGALVAQFGVTSHGITFAAFSLDGKYLVMGSSTGTTHIIEVASERQLVEFHGPGPVRGAAFSADGKAVLVLYESGAAEVFDTASGMQILSFVGYIH